MGAGSRATGVPGKAPARGRLILITLILGAIVANINTSISNVALPDIGLALHATNQELTAITDSYQVAIASTVIYLGAVGDRYGRRRLLALGAALSIPFSILSALAGSPLTLILAQCAVGVAGGMIFPTTLSLIASLWSEVRMTRAIALWASVGGGASAVGPVLGGMLLDRFWWGSVFLITVPIALAVLVLAIVAVPKHTGESTRRIDHPGGMLSIVTVLSFVLAIMVAPRGLTPQLVAFVAVFLVSAGVFWWREHRTDNPLFDFVAASAPTFWVAFVAALAAFGALAGTMYIGQQYMQNVIGLHPSESALMTLFFAVPLVASAPISSRMIVAKGTRVTMAVGLISICTGFVVVISTWHAGESLVWVALAEVALGHGVGVAAAPSGRSLTSSLPRSRAGMGSGATDLTKDLGGAVFQALMGTLLGVVYTAYFAKAFAKLPPDEAQALGADAAHRISTSFAGAESVASGFPQAEAEKLMAAAREAFTHGKTVAVLLALLLTLAATALVLWKYPKPDREEEFFNGVPDD